MGEVQHIPHHAFGVGPRRVLLRKLGQGRADLPLHHLLEQGEDLGTVGKAEHGPNRVFIDAGSFAFRGQGLVEDRKPVAHRAVGGPGDQAQGALVHRHALGLGDGGEMTGELVLGDAPEIEALAARNHCYRNLAGLGGGEDEFDVLRGFFQGLQKRVEGVGRQHVDFVDDIDLVARAGGAITHPFDQLAHVVDAGAAGRVHFQNVRVAPFGDGDAIGAGSAGRRCWAARAIGAGAVERQGNDPRRCRLTHPAHAGQQPGMGQAVGGDGIGEGAHQGVLADHLGEGLGSVFAGQHLIGRTGRRPLGAAAGTLAGRFLVVVVHALDPGRRPGKHHGFIGFGF